MSNKPTEKTSSHLPLHRPAKMLALKEPVLVTGAAGFMGRRLLKRLLDEGKEVVAFDVIACPESLEEDPNLTWVQGDIASRPALTQAAENCKTYFHLAAMVGDWGAEAQHQRVTVDGTENLFSIALTSGLEPTIVLASSIVVYGDQIGKGVCDESLPHGETFGPYGRAKQAQERIAQIYLQRGLDIRIVRPANVYGAGCKPWVEELCRELLKGSPCLIGGGDYDAGLVHVDNVVDILVRSARGQGLRGQIFNAADENGITWKRYMNDIAAICGAPKPRSVPRLMAYAMAQGLERSYRLLRISTRPPLTLEALNLVGSDHHIVMAKTKKMLGYRACVSYQQGLLEVEDYLSAFN